MGITTPPPPNKAPTVTRALLLTLFLFLPTLGHAQVLPTIPADVERSGYSRAAFYRYDRQGDLSMVVRVWGTVRHPGLYEVPVGASLNTVLTLAGGPAYIERRRQDNRTISVRVIRNGDVLLSEVVENDLFLRYDDLILLENDIVLLDTVVKPGILFREIAPFVSAGASLLVVMLQLVR